MMRIISFCQLLLWLLVTPGGNNCGLLKIVVATTETNQGQTSSSSPLSSSSNRIKVIGAGFGRTGTFSLKAALERLGYKAYHYVDFSHTKQWADHSKGIISTNDIIDLIIKDGYNATLENPTADLYRELLERFPNAKVVLTVRDTAEKFEESWKTLFETMELTERPFSLTFPSFFQWIPIFQHLKALRCPMGKHLGLGPCELTAGWRNQPHGWLAKQYEAHNAQVMETVPSDQLLVFNVKEGWGPLCQFLGEDIPSNGDEPFPNASFGVNDTASLKKLRKYFLMAVYGWIPCLLIMLFVTVQFMIGGGAATNKEKNH